MLTEKQLQQIRDTISVLNEQEKISTQEIIKTLNLPSWFDPLTCVIVMNRMHEKTFTEYNLEWIAFSDYIYFNEMIVMDKTIPYTPLTTYSKGDLF